jgi:hypothetical protein
MAKSARATSSLHPLVLWHMQPCAENPKMKVLQPKDAKHASRCCKEAERELRRLSKSADQNGSAKTRRRTRHAFHRFSNRLHAVLHQAKHKREKLTFQAAEYRARKVKNLAGQKEKIGTKMVSNGCGKARETRIFGPVRQAQQREFDFILQAIRADNPSDFSMKGKQGIHGAAKGIEKALIDGYRFWVISDIKQAYPSVTREHLKDLISLDVTLLRHIGFPNGISKGSSNQSKVRPVLPQGGIHSARLLSALTGEILLLFVGADVVVVVYADNIAIGAPTKKQAQHAFAQVRTWASSLQAGPLTLHQTRHCDGWNHTGSGVFEGVMGYNSVQFTGYRSSYDQTDGKVRHRPSDLSWRRHEWKVRHNILHKLSDIELDKMYVAPKSDHAPYLANSVWAHSFTLWKRIALSNQQRTASIDALVGGEIERRKKQKKNKKA